MDNGISAMQYRINIFYRILYKKILRLHGATVRFVTHTGPLVLYNHKVLQILC